MSRRQVCGVRCDAAWPPGDECPGYTPEREGTRCGMYLGGYCVAEVAELEIEVDALRRFRARIAHEWEVRLSLWPSAREVGRALSELDEALGKVKA